MFAAAQMKLEHIPVTWHRTEFMICSSGMIVPVLARSLQARQNGFHR
jgi:hypothetical protein